MVTALGSDTAMQKSKLRKPGQLSPPWDGRENVPTAMLDATRLALYMAGVAAPPASLGLGHGWQPW